MSMINNKYVLEMFICVRQEVNIINNLLSIFKLHLARKLIISSNAF